MCFLRADSTDEEDEVAQQQRDAAKNAELQAKMSALSIATPATNVPAQSANILHNMLSQTSTGNASAVANNQTGGAGADVSTSTSVAGGNVTSVNTGMSGEFEEYVDDGSETEIYMIGRQEAVEEAFSLLSCLLLYVKAIFEAANEEKKLRAELEELSKNTVCFLSNYFTTL